MNVYPLYMGPLDGLCVVYEEPPISIKTTQKFANCEVSDFYVFDPGLLRYVWASGKGGDTSPIRISPVSPLSSNP